MTKKRNLALIAITLVAIAAFAANGSLVRSLFGPRAMLNVSSGQSGQQGTTTHPGGADAWADPKAADYVAPSLANAKTLTTVAVTPDSRGDRGYILDARVVTKEGRPVANAVVRFYDVANTFGTQDMLIGAAATDGQGTVSISYKPAQVGTHQIIARPANAQLVATDGHATFDATVVAPSAYSRDRLPLASFSANLPLVGAAVVFFVWALFAFVLFGSFIRIPRNAKVDAPFTRKAREI